MKKLFLFLFLMLTAVSAFATDVKLAWNEMPAGQQWTAVRIYEKNGSVYNPVGEVSMPATEITLRNVSPGTHTYIARSVALVTPGSQQLQESVNSNEVTGVIIGQPSPVTITITIVVQ